jgi:MFS family permease
MRMLDPLLPMMAVGFGTTVSAVAILVAAFMLPYGAGQIATGPLGDRFGKVLVAGLALLLYGRRHRLGHLRARRWRRWG